MKKATGAHKVSEEEMFFFEDRLCPEADTVYRFAFALTLSSEAAEKATKRTYKDISQNISSFMRVEGDTELHAMLLNYTYAHVKDVNAAASSEDLDEAVVAYLKPLAKDVRAAVVARDIVGLDIPHIAKLIAATEAEVRQKLGTARATLVRGMMLV